MGLTQSSSYEIKRRRRQRCHKDALTDGYVKINDGLNETDFEVSGLEQSCI